MTKLYRVNVTANPIRLTQHGEMEPFKAPYDGHWDSGAREGCIVTDAELVCLINEGRITRARYIGELMTLTELDGKDPRKKKA